MLGAGFILFKESPPLSTLYLIFGMNEGGCGPSSWIDGLQFDKISHHGRYDEGYAGQCEDGLMKCGITCSGPKSIGPSPL